MRSLLKVLSSTTFVAGVGIIFFSFTPLGPDGMSPATWATYRLLIIGGCLIILSIYMFIVVYRTFKVNKIKEK